MGFRAYLALGANLGHRRTQIERAIALLGERIAIDAVSPLYETEPVGVLEQPPFLNLVLSGETDLDPEGLLVFAKEVERRIGRSPAVLPGGPRQIDVDILLFGDALLESASLSLPHPRMHERAFVLAPLADLAPGLRHPRSGKTVSELLGAVGCQGVKKVAPVTWKGPAKACLPSSTPRPLTVGCAAFLWGSRTYIVGIVNVTPDSFSGDGLLQSGKAGWRDMAVDRACRLAQEGADVIDVGGESTRPGAEPVPAGEEMRRILPVIEELAERLPVPISIDTSKAAVAEAALSAGAAIVNDVWALSRDPRMAEVAARAGAAVILMHNRSRPSQAEADPRLGGRYVGVEYSDVVEDVKRDLEECARLARAAGIPAEKIWLDPGIGFGKTREQNLELIDRLDAIRDLGHPVLVGPSRKSFIGYTLGLPPGERLEGTAAAVSISIARGADLVRVHDVREMVRVARMTDAIVRRAPGGVLGIPSPLPRS